MENIKRILEEKLENVNQEIEQANKFEELGQSETDAAQEYENIEQNQAQLEALAKEKEEIEIALNKIDNGTYGVCKACGGRIEPGRLQAHPTADECASCTDK